jgi:diguanylate cyclase (GGDEF)-like protein
MAVRVLERLAAFLAGLSIRAQIGLAAAAICLPLVACTALITGYLGAHQMSELLRHDLATTSQVLADRLSRTLAIRYREIQTVSRLKPLQPFWTGAPAELRSVLDELQTSYPYYSWIGFADNNGKVVSATKGMLEGASVATRPWFKNALDGPTVEDVHEAVLLAKLLGARSDGEPFRFVDIAFPVYDEHGRRLGVLGAHLSWDFASSLRSSTADAEREASLEILILARDGKILLGGKLGSTFDATHLQQLSTQPKGTYVSDTGPRRDLVGFASVQSKSDYPGLGWIVVARQPMSTALAPVYAIAWTTALAGLGIAALGLLLAMLLARSIAAPLQALTREADRLGRDPGVTMLSRHGGSKDVARLSTALRAVLRRMALAEHRSHAAEQRAEEGAQQFMHDLKVLRQMADRDPLTNLMNRRSFLAAGNDAFDYFRRYHRAIAALVLDIDHFKLVNDTYGHAAGDAAIKRVGEIIEQSLRVTDKVGRFGGEEFVILLREVDEEQTRDLAKRIIERIADEPVAYGTHAISLTASIGITMAVEADRDIQDTIERADRGLYMAKNTGRNRAFLMYPTESERAVVRAA